MNKKEHTTHKESIPFVGNERSLSTLLEEQKILGTSSLYKKRDKEESSMQEDSSIQEKSIYSHKNSFTAPRERLFDDWRMKVAAGVVASALAIEACQGLAKLADYSIEKYKQNFGYLPNSEEIQEKSFW